MTEALRRCPRFTAASLIARARLLADMRSFFAGRDVLEVDTPILNPAGATDPNIESFVTTMAGRSFYLHTSPEFAMKRFLAAGSGSIYQICKVFRAEECGRFHHPEFTMLEWYRLGFSHHTLMDEVVDLLMAVGVPKGGGRRSFAEVFEAKVGFNPHTVSGAALTQAIQAKALFSGETIPPLAGRAEQLDYLFAFCVAPALGWEGPELIYDFPVEQAALARIRPGSPPVAERFELFWKGVELANGFHELTDADEQLRRFAADNERRRTRGQQEVQIDYAFIAALRAGLPDCAGVALGIDRLLMLLANNQALAESTLPFADDLLTG